MKGEREMKRFGFIVALVALLGVLPTLANAAGICTMVNVGTSSTKVLAANDLGSNGRHMLCLQNTTAGAAAAAVTANCNVGGAAGVTTGIALYSGFVGTTTAGWKEPNMFCFQQTQQSAKTFPMVPNGEVDCIGSAATTNITACDY
jgi:hypothetical protein